MFFMLSWFIYLCIYLHLFISFTSMSDILRVKLDSSAFSKCCNIFLCDTAFSENVKPFHLSPGHWRRVASKPHQDYTSTHPRFISSIALMEENQLRCITGVPTWLDCFRLIRPTRLARFSLAQPVTHTSLLSNTQLISSLDSIEGNRDALWPTRRAQCSLAQPVIRHGILLQWRKVPQPLGSQNE